jgi:hypothetical protein
MKAMLDACLGNIEENPGELQSDWEHQGFPEEEAAVKSFGALNKEQGFPEEEAAVKSFGALKKQQGFPEEEAAVKPFGALNKQQGFSEEEAAVKSFGALNKQHGDLPVAARRRWKSKKPTQLFSM